DGVVDDHALGHHDDIVHHAQLPQEEGLGASLILDSPPLVVVLDPRPPLASLDLELRLAAHRRPPPLSKLRVHLDTIGDPPPPPRVTRTSSRPAPRSPLSSLSPFTL